jgi:hypothetical protein
MTCPNCGNTSQVDVDNKQVSCGFCGNPLFLNNTMNGLNGGLVNNNVTPGNTVQNNTWDGVPTQLGRNVGQGVEQFSGKINYSNKQSNSNNKIWLWVIGWIFIFPVPLTILILRSNRFNKDWKIGLVSGGWFIWLFFSLIFNVGVLSAGNKNTSKDSTTEAVTEATTRDDSVTKEMPTEEEKKEIITSNIKDIIVKDTEIEVAEYEESKKYKIEVDVNDKKDFSIDDILFVSEDENVATIRCVEASLTTQLYYVVTGIVPGETYVYAKAKDGEIESERIKVIVKDDGHPNPESISIISDVTDMAVSETCQLSIETVPEDATYKNINWTSSDTSVLKVDESGVVTAVGGGTATITSTVLNDIQASYEITVDESKKTFLVKVKKSRDDNNNIGDEWSYINYVNGETSVSSISLSAGETVTVSSRYSEDDKNPDVGEGYASYTVTEDDLKNGFEVTYDFYVTENGGKNSGQSAHFTVTYTFSVK